MRKYIIAFILVCFFISPGAASAADTERSPEVTRLMGTFAPKTGAWAEYALFDKATGVRTVMRMSIVGVESDSYWYEVITREGKESNIVKMMVTGNPNDPENIKRIIVKPGTEAAREMDRDSAQKVRLLASQMFEQRSGIPAGLDNSMQDVKTGEEVAVVPAGTFDVSLHQIMDASGKVYARYKYSAGVRPFGIVTSETENATMVLVGHGDGATSLITEEPVMMKLPPKGTEELFKDLTPEKTSLQGMESTPGNSIKQIPGMGTGYEPKE